ncbi:hypothetical protein [Parvibaculum sp. MBR-TMA-1.3b-4.2]|jgi:hypothetical protein
MRSSLLYSVGMHVVILGLAIVVLPSPDELPSVETRALPVDLVTIDEFTNLKRQVKTEKKVEKPKEAPKPPAPERPEPKSEPKSEPTPAPPAPKAPQQAKAEAKPEARPEPLPTKEAKKEPKPAPKEKPKPKPKPAKKVQKSAPAEKKKSFDPNRLAALLNKMPEDNAPKRPQQQAEAQVDAPRTDDPDMPLTMSEVDAFRVQMAKCWTVPAGAAGAEKLAVKIRVFLNPDGSLGQPPELMDRTKLITGGATYRAAADAALRAVRLCQPFKMPADKYNSWREIELNFDPRQMLGG